MDLLPGMYSMPVHVVPKVAGSDKLRLIVDHSTSSYSLNSMIMRDDIAGAHLDTIKDLANSIIQFRHQFGNVKLVLFKSDVSAAYRRLPMHPFWQIKQNMFLYVSASPTGGSLPDPITSTEVLLNQWRCKNKN